MISTVLEAINGLTARRDAAKKQAEEWIRQGSPAIAEVPRTYAAELTIALRVLWESEREERRKVLKEVAKLSGTSPKYVEARDKWDEANDIYLRELRETL